MTQMTPQATLLGNLSGQELKTMVSTSELQKTKGTVRTFALRSCNTTCFISFNISWWMEKHTGQRSYHHTVRYDDMMGHDYDWCVCVCVFSFFTSSQREPSSGIMKTEAWTPMKRNMRCVCVCVCHWVRPKASHLGWDIQSDLRMCNDDFFCHFHRGRKQSWSTSSSSWAKSSPSCLSSPALWPSRKGSVQFSAFAKLSDGYYFSSGNFCGQETHSPTCFTPWI